MKQRNKILRLFFLILCMSILTILSTGCGTPAVNNEENNQIEKVEDTNSNLNELFKAGTYTAIAPGHNGEFNVDVTFDDNKIIDIKINENYESLALGDIAMEQVKQEIISRQSINVDTISGATISSKALLYAVKDTIKQADGDLSKLDIPLEIDTNPLPDENVDVVVVGSGSAGLSATVEASDLGLNVILVEQLGVLGGSSMRTAYLRGCETELQKEAGITKTVDEFISDMTKVSNTLDKGLYNEEGAIKIAKEAGKNIDWLQSLGIKFGKINFNDQHYGPEGIRLGSFLISGLQAVLDNRGVDYRLNTRAIELLMEDEKVVGIKVEAPNGTTYNINADAVILATGGYFANEEMVKKYLPKFAGTGTDVSIGSDGSGMLMAESIGGKLAYMDQGNYNTSTIWRGASRSAHTAVTNGSIVVNQEGKRFVNENASYEVYGHAVMDQEPNGKVFTILDQTIKDLDVIKADKGQTAEPEIYEVADTLEELAEKLGINPEALVNTVETYSSYVKNGNDLDFGRSTSAMKSDFTTAPYYAIRTTVQKHTMHGGVVIDVDAHVLNNDGNIIPGLYAAGEVTASFVQGKTTNTACIAYGRTAARTVKADMDN